jgi:hypothetical protein
MKKRPSKGAPPDFAVQLGLVEQRLAGHEAALDEIGRRVQALGQLAEGLAEVRSIALEAVAQAQDAHDAASLSREHDARLNNLTLAVAEGIQHVERAEARIRATVGRAKRQLNDAGLDSPGVDSEALTLGIRDGDGGAEGGVQPVRPKLASPPPVDPLEAQLRALRLWGA